MSSSSDSGALALVYRIEASARLGADRRAQPGRDLLLARVRGEFSEMPCLSLTIPQAMRLFGLREDICGAYSELSWPTACSGSATMTGTSHARSAFDLVVRPTV